MPLKVLSIRDYPKDATTIDVTPVIKIIDSNLFQLKGDIKQLDFIYKIIRGATHTRFEHMVGTYELAKLLLNSIKINEDNGFRMSDSEELTVRVGALLHDIGHPPFSHGVEQILMSLKQPDHDEKSLEFILSNEDLIRKVKDKNRNTKEDVNVNYELLCKIFSNKKNHPYAPIIWDIVGADKLDYINRDAGACGIGAKSELDKIIPYAYFDGKKYGIETKSSTWIAHHISNWITMHDQVYLRKSSNIIKSKFRRGFYYLVNDGLLEPGSVYDMGETDLIKVFMDNEESSGVWDEIKYRRFPKTFASLKIEGFNEDKRNKKIKQYSMSEAELMDYAKKLEDINLIISLEERIEEALGYDNCSISISEMPHIKRISEKNANVYDRNEHKWFTVLDMYPEKRLEFINSAKRMYAIRLCVKEKLRNDAYNNADKVINILREELE